MVHLYLKHLKDLGFSINTYNRCVDNKMIDGNQCNIVWYVDENKLLHADINVFTLIVEKIKNHFGYLVIRRDDTHDLLGMTKKIRNDKKVELMTKHQIEDMVLQFNDICNFKVTLPDAQH